MALTSDETSVLALQRVNRENGRPTTDWYYVNVAHITYAAPAGRVLGIDMTVVELVSGTLLYVRQSAQEVAAWMRKGEA